MKLKGLGLAVSMLMVGCAGGSAGTTAPSEGSASAPESVAAAPERQSVARAVELYAERDYEAAALAFEDAYAEDPDASLLLARAQALRLSGQCDQARDLYDQFLVTATDPTYRNAVERLLDGCKPPADADADSQVAAR